MSLRNRRTSAPRRRSARRRNRAPASFVAAAAFLAGRATAPPAAMRPLSDSIVTRSLDVDGLAVRVRTANLTGRAPGEAAVVFESGGATPLETWDPVLAAVARFAPVVAYDRAGTGESAWDGLPPTPERVGARLERILDALRVPPPYVLVGHSWGGALVRYFAAAHPDRVAGVLYLDPTDITLTRADMVALFESFGAGAQEYDAFAATMKQALAGAPVALRAEADVILSLLERAPRQRSIPAAPDLPSSVIVAGRIAAPPRGMFAFDTDAYARALHASQVRRLRAWVRGGGTFRVATDAGHLVHADEPALVVSTIQALIGNVRRDSR
jgi:pimeloyl-ACP methyl ester carboxylesterase